MQRPKPIVLAAIAAGVILLLVIGIILLRGGNENQDRLPDEINAAAERRASEEDRCSSQRTYDLIKRELFRQAARIRGSDAAAFDRIASYSAVRMERPVKRSEDEDLGTAGCSGVLTLDLPPGVAVAGGRRSLSAEIGYILQRSADGSGDAVMIEGADPIVVPLATLARTRAAVAVDPNAVEGMNEMTPALPLPGPIGAPPAGPAPAPEPEPSADTGPSFDCRYARTRSESAVCNNQGLAALDRQMAAQFGRALGTADAEQRALLQRTRTRFLRYREGCRSNDCFADAYRGRMREIGDIMADRWQPPR